MSSTKALTGGTSDVNPQLLNLTVTQTAADTSTTLEQPIPVPRFTAGKARSLVIEILWLQWNFANLPNPNGVTVNFTGILSTAATAAVITDPRTFACIDFEIDSAAAPTDAPYYPRTYRQYFHDGAGHGLLVATDAIFLTLASASTTAANTVNVKIAYRFKEVALAEYIGIVQSQQ